MIMDIDFLKDYILNNSVLIITIVFFVLIFILIIIKIKKQLPYKLNSSLLTKRELKFFAVLNNIIDEKNFVIAIKPRMADFIAIDNQKLKKKSYMTYFNKIKSKHVDFLICDISSMKPILAIELDDKSHEKKERVMRDKFVDEVYETVGLEIIHVYEYDYSSLKKIIGLYL